MDSNESGFTLVELMVALTLLGLIATMLVSGTRLTLDISARGNSKTDAMRTQHLGHEILRGQLQDALPYRYWEVAEGSRLELMAFEGDSDRVRFVSRYGVLDGPESLPRWVDLREEKGPDNKSELIVEEHRIFSPNNQPGETATARAEVLKCADLHFDYLDTTEKPQWLTSWSGPKRKAPLPAAIRMQCRAAEGPVKLLITLDYAESARLGMRLQ